MYFTSTWVRNSSCGSGLRFILFSFSESLCLISSSVSRCYQSGLLYFLWRPDWEQPFCRGTRGLYKSLDDCCQCRMHRLQWLFSPGAAYLCRSQDGNWGGTLRKASCCSKKHQSGDTLSCTPYREEKLELFGLSLAFLVLLPLIF